MARPRTRDAHLQKCVYFRHGSFFYVKRGVWTKIGETLEEANRNIERLPEILEIPREELLKYTMKVYTRARQNAKGRRGIDFSLERSQVEGLLRKSHYRCSVTGVPFTLEVINGKKPYAPSIDRIDSDKGYSMENCRIVCVAANYAMNVWGDVVLKKMIKGGRRLKVLDTVQ